MKHKKKTKYIVVGIVIIFLIIFSYQLLWCKLFPYSPVKIGFMKHNLSNVVVYAQNGSTYYDYNKIDTLISAIEKFHNLNFIRKPEILFFRDSNSYSQRSITKARFCAYPNGSLVVSPWAVQEALDGKISMEIYLRHELSHTLLYQHMGVVTAYFFYPRWLLEGIAVYSTNQMGTSWYPSKKETYNYIRQGNFLPPEYFNTKKEDEVKLEVKYKTTFMYSEFACIVDYLIETYGKQKFIQYMAQLLDSCQHDKVFRDVYGIDFENCLHNFKRYVSEHV
jgi:GR25 family glycosyltransferase involved in LPS biosynthesis